MYLKSISMFNIQLSKDTHIVDIFSIFDWCCQILFDLHKCIDYSVGSKQGAHLGMCVYVCVTYIKILVNGICQ